ncbi:MAG: SUMF1/EgtB/PvdO family nonheme iron enzyme [Myxococcota bacterium]
MIPPVAPPVIAPAPIADSAPAEPPACATHLRDGTCLPAGFKTPGGIAWVGIGDDRWMTRTEVTAAEYAACVAAGQCDARQVGRAQATATRTAVDKGCNYGAADRGQHPMNCVSQAEAATFCAWQGGALPTTDDWEMETLDGRAHRTHPWGEADASCAVTVMGDTPKGGCGRGGTWPVCAQAGDTSASGLCDMGGNVTEWLGDVPRDMIGKIPDDHAVLAGGAWHYDQAIAFDNGVYSAEARTSRFTTVGFRCVRDAAF